MHKRKAQNPAALMRILRMMVKDYPLQIMVVLVCIVVAAICGAAAPVFIERMTDCILNHVQTGWAGAVPDVLRLLSVMIAIYVVGLAASTIQAQIMARLTQGSLHKLRTRLFDRMQELPISYFDTHNHGDIMSHYTNDVDALRQLISQSIPSLISAGLTVFCLLLAMIFYSLPLMLVVLVGIFLMMQVTRVVGGRSARYFKRQQETIGKAEGFVEEMMHGQKVVKVFCHEDATIRDFDVLNDQLYEDVKSANTFGNIFGPMMNNIGNMLYVLMAFVGGLMLTSGLHNISLQSLITTGSMLGIMPLSVVASYLGLVKQFTGNINQVSQQINSIAMAIAGATRVCELLDQQPEPDEGKVTLVNCREENGEVIPCSEHTGLWAWRCPMEGGGFRYVRLRGDVRFFDVDFAYVEGKTVLHNISLYAKPGQKLAFVGSTGAGKTTIANLINRFYDIADGKIRYDGININHIAKADLRRSLGVVLQDVNLFTGTVMDNIRYGKLDATDDECIQAAKLANAHDFITRLPQGYQTVLAGNGANLSQGQRQLLSIARAAVADPPVMILDEATSSIDTRTERLVQEGMDALMEGRTVFVIAHRLSTIRNSNAIMVLKHGRIIERGTHDELLEQKGVYHSLHTGAFEME